jgi:hypothetical protein
MYSRLNQWDNVFENAKKALEIAKIIKEYSIAANAYIDIATSFEKHGDQKKGQNYLFEAMDYFSKEAAQYEQSQDLLPLSQLYQIIKNIYGYLRDSNRFEIYSRKEAGVYIALAKLGLLNNTSNTQIASYYRGAALCYRETNQNDIDCASCFLLAGNYYSEAKKYVESSLNYQDAAVIFERIKKYKKAFDLYLKAGESAVKANNLEIAIENFMQAEEITKYDQLDWRKVINLLIKNLEKLAIIQEAAKNHFVAATLYLEVAKYELKLPNNTNGNNQNQFLEKCYKNYYLAAKSANELGKKSSIAYAYALAALSAYILNKFNDYNELISVIEKPDAKTSQNYALLVKSIIECKNEEHPINLTDDKRLGKLYDSSDEIQKLLYVYLQSDQKKKSVQETPL